MNRNGPIDQGEIDAQTQEKKKTLMVTNGKRWVEGLIRSLGLTNVH